MAFFFEYVDKAPGGKHTFGLVGLLISHNLGFVEGGEACKSLVQHLIVCLIAQVTHKDTKIIFRPFQEIWINPVAGSRCLSDQSISSGHHIPPALSKGIFVKPETKTVCKLCQES